MNEMILSKYTLLCLDEFQVTNISDAMLLVSLFTELYKSGSTANSSASPFVLVTTSNRPPDDLYLNGLQRASFLPCIDLIKAHNQVICLDSPTDHRRRAAFTHSHWLFPLTPDTKEAFERALKKKVREEHLPSVPASKTLKVFGRSLKIDHTFGHIARFSFADLCMNNALSANDYIEIARSFKIIFIEGIPRLDVYRKRDATRRFIQLIDALYEHHVELFCTAECPMEELLDTRIVINQNKESSDESFSEPTSAAEEVFAFERSLSRLYEMNSAAWKIS